MRSHGTFNFSVIALTALCVAGAAAFNYVIDPYSIYDSARFGRINKEKPIIGVHCRLYKAHEISLLKPKAIILGSSRAALGLDPSQLDQSYQPAYNAALDGANMHELEAYFEHALSVQPELKEVIIGLDYQMFRDNRQPAPDFCSDRLGKKSLTTSDLLDTLCSADALHASLETIIKNLRSRGNDLRYFLANGERDEARMLDNPVEERWRSSLELDKPLDKVGGYSQESLRELKRLVEQCHRNNIALKVFVSPSHALEWELLRAQGRWRDFQNWKRDLANITPFWDFSGYNAISTEPLSGHMQYYLDSSHYRPVVGAMVLKQLTHAGTTDSAASSRFGRFCQAQTVNQVISQIDAERKNNMAVDWQNMLSELRAHPEYLAKIADSDEISLHSRGLPR